MSAIRIGLASMLQGRMGSVALPEEVKLFCPQCGEPVMDKGQCALEMREVFDATPRTTIARLLVDCRVCQCVDKEPTTRPKHRHE
jgi:hypothetical protein